MKIDDAPEQHFLEVYLRITGISSAAKVSTQMKRKCIEGYWGSVHTPPEEAFLFFTTAKKLVL